MNRLSPHSSVLITFLSVSLCLCGNLLAAAPTTQPYHLHIPGVSGILPLDRGLVRGLAEGGLKSKIEIFDWTCNDPGMNALVKFDRNKQQAKKVSDLLLEKFRADPNRPITITAESGGAAIAVWALEDLPADVKIDTLVLLCPALSPQYDLSNALRHVRGKAYVFSSIYDTIVLGAGTRFFGTMDRVKTDAAGRVGFTQPKTADPDQYAKLVSIPYDRAWIRLGNIGDHAGPMHRAFVRAVVAPLIISHKDTKTQR